MGKGKRDYIQESQELYSQDAEKGKYPVSWVDGDIMKRLIELLAERNETRPIAAILQNWKRHEDNVILHTLLEYQHQDFVDFIQIGKHMFQAFMLLSLRPVQRWDKKTTKPIHSILINEGPLPANSQWEMDIVIDFESEEQRDKELESVKQRLVEFRNVRFL